MLNKKRSLIILIIAWLGSITSSSLAQHPHERDLGYEDSPELMERVAKLYTGDRLDPEKIEAFRKRTQTRREELFEILKENRLSEGKSEKKAIKKASKDRRVAVLDHMLKRIQTLTQTRDLMAQRIQVKDLLKLSQAYIKDGRVLDVVQAYEIVKIGFFEKHKVPVNDLKRNLASNLLNPKTKQYLKKKTLKSLVKKGYDISKLDPPNTSFWTKPESIGNRNPLLPREVKGDVPTVYYYKKIKRSDQHPKLAVYSLDENGNKEEWKMKFGREVNTEYTISRMMRLMGFFYDQYYYLPKAKVYFEGDDTYESMARDWMEFFSRELERPMSYLEEKGEDEGGSYIIMRHVAVELHPENVERVGPFHYTQLGAYDRREVRAQLLVQSFFNNTGIKEAHNNKLKLVTNEDGSTEVQELVHDVGKSFGSMLIANLPNAYKWNFLKKKRGKVRFAYQRYHAIPKERNPFMQAGYSDLKWMARYMASIKRSQIKKIIENAGWPEAVTVLLLEKMTVRRNEVVKTFDLEGERFDGQTIRLWEEVNPDRFDYKDVIKDGELVDTYNPKGWDFSFTSGADVNFNFDGFVLQYILQMVSMGMRQAPVHKLISLESNHGGDLTFNKWLGLLGVRFSRNVSRNADTGDDTMFRVHDTIQVFATIGFGIEVPIGGGFTADIEGNPFMGREWSLTKFARTLDEATRSDIKRIFKMPFKWKQNLKKLKIAESAGRGSFIGLILSEEFRLGSQFSGAFGVGFNQNMQYLNRLSVTKRTEHRMEVVKEKSKELAGSTYLYGQLFRVLQIRFLSASIMLGRAKGNIFYFDFEENPDLEHFEAYSTLVHKGKDKLALKRVEHADLYKKYRETAWQIGFGATLGTTKRGTYMTRVDPDQSIYRSYHYDIVRSKINPIRFRQTEHRINAVLDFEDEDFKHPISRRLEAVYYVDNQLTRTDKLAEYIDVINGTYGHPLIKFTPSLYADKHHGQTLTYYRIDFTEDALACLMENVGCAEDKIDGRRLNWKLRRIRGAKTETKKISRLARWVSRKFRDEEDFQKIRRYVGEDKLAHEAYIWGEFLPSKRKIHVLRKAGREL